MSNHIMKRTIPTNNGGFTLVELMIALVISSFVLLGITGTYSTIHGTIQASKELENAQEVIRYSSQVFTRSLKQTWQVPTFVNGNQMLVKQKANTRSCTGSVPVVDYTEIFTFVQPNLSCSLEDLGGNEISPDTILLTGIDALNTVPNGNLFSITVAPTVLPENFVGGVRIDIALTNLILQTAMPAP